MRLPQRSCISCGARIRGASHVLFSVVGGGNRREVCKILRCTPVPDHNSFYDKVRSGTSGYQISRPCPGPLTRFPIHRRKGVSAFLIAHHWTGNSVQTAKGGRHSRLHLGYKRLATTNPDTSILIRLYPTSLRSQPLRRAPSSSPLPLSRPRTLIRKPRKNPQKVKIVHLPLLIPPASIL